MNHTKEETNRARSHKNDENMRRMIFMGESAIVKQNIASGVPKARNAQPKNSATVIFLVSYQVLKRRNSSKNMKTYLFDKNNDSRMQPAQP